jgi:hypothetical protein
VDKTLFKYIYKVGRETRGRRRDVDAKQADRIPAEARRDCDSWRLYSHAGKYLLLLSAVRRTKITVTTMIVTRIEYNKI